jgi:hypothetical protein
MVDSNTTNALVVTEEVNLDGPSAEDFEVSLRQAQAKAATLKRLISENNWSVNIQGHEHIRVEAWITTASSYGCTAKVIETERLSGYKQAFLATAVVLRHGLGEPQVIGQAFAECGTRGDGVWEESQPEYAVRSMAQTRAISKAIASVFRWVVVLAGYQGTPYEEMDHVRIQQQPAAQPAGQPARQQTGEGGGGDPTASDAQLRYLSSLGYEITPAQAQTLSRRKASQLIEQLKAGQNPGPIAGPAPENVQVLDAEIVEEQQILSDDDGGFARL